MTLATVVLAVIMRALKHPWPFTHWKELLLLGFLGVAGPHVLYSWAALKLPAGYAALLSVTAVLFGAFASALLKEETLTRTKLAGCFVGLLGAALVVRLGPVEPTPALIFSALVAMLAAAISGNRHTLYQAGYNTHAAFEYYRRNACWSSGPDVAGCALRSAQCPL